MTHYLVKWRSLPYEDATWELEEDVDMESIRKFNQLQLVPPEDELQVSMAVVIIDLHIWKVSKQGSPQVS